MAREGKTPPVSARQPGRTCWRGTGTGMTFCLSRPTPMWTTLLWGGGDFPGAGRRGLPGVYAPLSPTGAAWKIFVQFGKPRLGVFISGGNLDSMVAHYTAAKKAPRRGPVLPRREDRPAARPGHHRLRQPGPGGLWPHPADHRRPGGLPCAALPTTTTGRTRCAAASS